MTRTILLHIGAPKAGSTYLQRVLLQNRDRLAAAGIAYPHPGTGHPGNARDLARIDEAGFEALFEGGATRVILSHEDLFAVERDAQPLSRLARAARVPVQKLVFLRPWSHFCLGDYSQHMKQNFDRYLAARNPFDGKTFEEMAARRAAQIDVVAFFLRWARVFPLPPLVIAPHTEIRATVERLTGLTDMDWSVPRHLTNPSLRLCDLEEIASLMRDPAVPAEQVRQVYLAAYHRTAEADPLRTPELIARIEALFERQNRELRDVYRYDNRAVV
ncbi:MAG: hypothetical protein KF887_09505 [Paracoccaceae bacterium]|nr:MAG: hypothetical protein KF887_09505 [Paracoccaceae bacterium]